MQTHDTVEHTPMPQQQPAPEAKPSRKALLRQLLTGRDAAGRRRRRGMTLVEIMVVIILIAGIGTALAVTVFGVLDEGQTKTTRLQLKTISNQLTLYRASRNEFPDSLQKLVEKQYIEKDMLQDPWGQDIQYSVRGRTSFELCSPGQDGQRICHDDEVVDEE